MLCKSTLPASPAGKYPIDIAPGTLAARDDTFSFKDGVLTITAP